MDAGYEGAGAPGGEGRPRRCRCPPAQRAIIGAGEARNQRARAPPNRRKRRAMERGGSPGTGWARSIWRRDRSGSSRWWTARSKRLVPVRTRLVSRSPGVPGATSAPRLRPARPAGDRWYARTAAVCHGISGGRTGPAGARRRILLRGSAVPVPVRSAVSAGSPPPRPRGLLPMPPPRRDRAPGGAPRPSTNARPRPTRPRRSRG